MGNRCFIEKKKEPVELQQIAIIQKGTCDMCDKKDVYGCYVKSVIEDVSIFMCHECK